MRKVKIMGKTYEDNQGSDKSCEICGKCETVKGNNGRTKRLAVDHNHRNGVIRGRLCQRCNTALGLFCDDISVLQNAIDYLKISRDEWKERHEKEMEKAASKIRFPYD